MLKDEMANELLNTVKILWCYICKGSEHLNEYVQFRGASD